MHNYYTTNLGSSQCDLDEVDLLFVIIFVTVFCGKGAMNNMMIEITAFDQRLFLFAVVLSYHVRPPPIY